MCVGEGGGLNTISTCSEDFRGLLPDFWFSQEARLPKKGIQGKS